MDTDRLSALRGRSGMTEAGVGRVLVNAIKTMTFYANLFKVVSSDCIEQKGTKK